MSANAEPPPLVEPPAKPAAATRVIAGLVLFGLLDLGQSVSAIVSALKGGDGFHVSLSFGFMPAWGAALLVWMDKRVIWPLMSYASALVLGSLIGAALGSVLGLPAKLILVLAKVEPFNFWSGLAYFFLPGIFLVWLLFESERTRDAWRSPAAKPASHWIRPKRCLVYPIVPVALAVWGLLALLHGSWTSAVIERARATQGAGYDYLTINYQMQSRNGQTAHQAVVLAYSDSEIHRIPLAWSD